MTALAELIVRDVCETDPADPNHEESVIVNVRTLEQLIDARIGAIESELSARKDGKITNKMKAERQRSYDMGVATERSRWTALRDQVQTDIGRPEGRWGMHGHRAVDDDYFAALEWVVERMDDVLRT